MGVTAVLFCEDNTKSTAVFFVYRKVRAMKQKMKQKPFGQLFLFTCENCRLML